MSGQMDRTDVAYAVLCIASYGTDSLLILLTVKQLLCWQDKISSGNKRYNDSDNNNKSWNIKEVNNHS